MSYPRYASTPRSPSRKQIADVVATTSSRPPFGFVSTLMVILRALRLGASALGLGPWAGLGGRGVRPHASSLKLRASSLLLRDLHDCVVGVLLEDREQTGIEKSHLEEHQERHCRVDAVGQRVKEC